MWPGVSPARWKICAGPDPVLASSCPGRSLLGPSRAVTKIGSEAFLLAVMELDRIPLDEVLRYLGAAGRDPGPLLPLAEDCAGELLQTARPRWTWRGFGCDVTPEGVRLDCGFLLPGRDLAGHLAGCREAVLLAATLSPGVDALLRRTQLSDLSRSLVLESCAAAAIEEVCGRAGEIIRESYPGRSFTSRFSPGYGDLPLTVQGEFLALLDAPRRLGLCATGSSILTPRKSVTAVIGVGEPGVESIPRERGCGSCSLRETCAFRRAGTRDRKSVV